MVRPAALAAKPGMGGALQVTLQHPVSTNRIAMWFALLGAALGILSLVIAFVAV